MKKLLFTIVIAASISCVCSAQDKAGVLLNASFGMSHHAELVYELELGIKTETGKLFFTVPGIVYNAKVDGDRRSHVYYGIRANYLFYTNSKTAALSPFTSYLRHQTAEGGRQKSNDWDAGIRFYKFAVNPGARAAAWTYTVRYLHTKKNVFNSEGASHLAPENKFIVSIGIHGLF